jgi:hypothetical protein
MAKKTNEQNATEFYAAAHKNYETWGHWVYETESVATLAEAFAAGQYKSVADAVRQAKQYAEYAADIQATAW